MFYIELYLFNVAFKHITCLCVFPSRALKLNHCTVSRPQCMRWTCLCNLLITFLWGHHLFLKCQKIMYCTSFQIWTKVKAKCCFSRVIWIYKKIHLCCIKCHFRQYVFFTWINTIWIKCRKTIARQCVFLAKGPSITTVSNRVTIQKLILQEIWDLCANIIKQDGDCGTILNCICAAPKIWHQFWF